MKGELRYLIILMKNVMLIMFKENAHPTRNFDVSMLIFFSPLISQYSNFVNILWILTDRLVILDRIDDEGHFRLFESIDLSES